MINNRYKIFWEKSIYIFLDNYMHSNSKCKGAYFCLLAHFQLKIQSVPALILTWFLNLKSSDLIGWNIRQSDLVKRRRRSSRSFNCRWKKGGGMIAPQSFTDMLFLSQLETKYFFCSPWILDLPTALIQVLFCLTHENLWRHYLARWLICDVTI